MPRKPTTVFERSAATGSRRPVVRAPCPRPGDLGAVCGRKPNVGHTQRQAKAWQRANLRLCLESSRT